MTRSRIWWMAMVGLLVAVLFALPSAATAVTGWRIIRLTTDAHYHIDPDVYGDRVVWLGGDGRHYGVFTRKIGVDASPIKLTPDSHPQYDPRVSGDRIVWRGRPGTNYQIFTWKAGDSSPTTLTNDSRAHGGPRVSGDRVAWTTHWSAPDGTYHGQLFTWKAGDSSPTTLTADARVVCEYEVSGDRVVWTTWSASEGEHYQLFTWKAGDSAPTTLTPETHTPYDPQAAGDRVVWTGYDGAHWQIFAWKAGDSAPSMLTTDQRNHGDPQISGDRVVWVGSDGKYWQIYTRRFGDTRATKLTTDARRHVSPQLSGNRVAWRSWDGSHYRIQTRRIGVDESPVTLLVVSGDYVNWNGLAQAPEYRLSGDRVVWFLRYAGQPQIYRAKRITKPKIARSPSGSSLTVYRHDGVARYTLAATVRDRDGTLVAGKRVYLQTSPDGRTWRNTYKMLRTDRSGRVSKSFIKSRRMTLYYRWCVPASASYRRAYAAAQRVRVR